MSRRACSVSWHYRSMGSVMHVNNSESRHRRSAHGPERSSQATADSDPCAGQEWEQA